MGHATTITTGGGIIRHHNAITTEPGFCVQILEFHDCKVPKLADSTYMKDDHQFFGYQNELTKIIR